MSEKTQASAVEILDAPASEHGEGPVWDPTHEVLHWVDLTRGVVHHLRGDDSWTADHFDTEVTALAPHVDGGLVAATSDGFAYVSEGRLHPLSNVLADRPDLRMNDGGCDRAGRFLAGSMAYDAAPHAGTLHRLDLDGQVTTLAENVTIPNGLDWSPDGSLLYFTDSGAQVVTAYDYDHGTGAMTGPRTFLDFASVTGEPDGLTVDSEGNLWVAVWDGWQVRCYDPEGQLLLEIAVPVQRPTSVAFGGPELSDLFITTSSFGLSAAAVAAQPAAGRLLRSRSTAVGRSPDPCQVELTSIPTEEGR